MIFQMFNIFINHISVVMVSMLVLSGVIHVFRLEYIKSWVPS